MALTDRIDIRNTTRAARLLQCRVILLLCAIAAVLSPRLGARESSTQDPLDEQSELLVQTGHATFVWAAAASPDDRILATGSIDQSLKLWDVATGRSLRTIPHEANVALVAFSADGRVLVSVSNRRVNREVVVGRVNLWDVASGTSLGTFVAHDNFITAIALSDDGLRLATGAGDGVLKLWAIEARDAGSQLRQMQSAPPRQSFIRSLMFSADGRWLASATQDGVGQLWGIDGETGRSWNATALFDFRERKLAGPYIYNVSADGNVAVAIPDGRTVALWDAQRGVTRQVGALGGDNTPILPMAVSRDQRFLAATIITGGSNNGAVRVWDVQARREVRTTAAGDSALSVALTRTGETVAIGHASGLVTLWKDRVAQPLALSGGTRRQFAVAYNHDGRLLASGHTDGTVRVWDIESGGAAVTIPAHAEPVARLLFGPASAPVLASASFDGTVRLWNPTNGTQIHSFTYVAQPSSIRFPLLAFSGDGTMLATLGGDATTLDLWDVRTGGKQRSVTLGAIGATALAFSSDSRMIVTGSADGTVTIWEAASGRPLHRFRADGAMVHFVGFTSDGTAVAALSSEDDGTKPARNAWDLPSGLPGAGPAARYQTAFEAAARGNNNFQDRSADGRVIAKGEAERTDLIDASTGRVIGSLIPIAEKDWAVVTPEGLFDGTYDAMQQVSWRLGRGTLDVFPLDVFFNEYFRPGLLSELLGGERPKPVVDLASRLRLPGLRTLLAQGRASIQRRAGESVLCFDERPTVMPNVYANGRLVTLELESLIASGAPGCPSHYPLPAGTQYEVVNSAPPAPALRVQTRYDGVRSDTPRSTLHVLTVGVGAFGNTAGLEPLPGSVVAARSIESFFRDQRQRLSGGLFDGVRVWDGLYDASATRASIRKTLSDIAAATKEEDVVVLFFSGHGIVPAGQAMFHFAPYDIRGPNPDEQRVTAVDTAMLASAIREMRAGRVVLIIDACQSGGAVESLAKIGAVKVAAGLRRRQPGASAGSANHDAIGVAVLAAATPLQVAIQRSAEAGSALVQTLLAGFEAAASQNGTVWLSDLFSHVERTLPSVSERLGHKHAPMAEIVGADFPIAVSRRAAP